MKKISIIAGVLFLCGAAALVGSIALRAQSLVLQVPVSSSDLQNAGYTNVTVQGPTSGERFGPPVLYFRVDQTLSPADAALDCADCNNLVAVYAMKLSSAPQLFASSDQIVGKMGGRAYIQMFVPAVNEYISVIAPDNEKALKLAQSIAQKF